MGNRKKNILYTIILVIAVFVVWQLRKPETPKRVDLVGNTMGTTYHITYFDTEGRNFQPGIDSLLRVFNESLSTYIPDSEVSRFNSGGSLKFSLPYFFPVLNRSREIVQATQGSFDPTVMPLVKAWGFGPGKSMDPDSAQVDSIRAFVGFENIQFNRDSIWKLEPRTQLDFSAVAKGYGVDVVVQFIESKGIENLFVEIGGEVVAKGKNLEKNRLWEIGILDPNSTYENQFFKAYATIEDGGVATSGNYFNYREVNGRKFSHTLDPETGYPVQREILSASVFAKDCMTADAYATAFMVMGYKRAHEILEQNPALNAVLTYTADDGTIKVFVTPGIERNVKIN